jgi:hypothetical protein
MLKDSCDSQRSQMAARSRRLLGLGPLLLLWALTGCGEDERTGGVASEPLSRETRTVLSGTAAEAALKACSGSMPRNVSGLWVPDDAMMDAIDQQLPSKLGRALRQVVHRTDEMPKASDYYRQYIGLRYRSGRQTVHVNGFYRGHLQRTQGLALPEVQLEKDSLDWKTSAINSCDGGYWFFSAEYDLERDRFVRFELNGGIGG